MRTSLILHFDLLPAVDMLSNAEAGKFLKAILRYNVRVLCQSLGWRQKQMNRKSCRNISFGTISFLEGNGNGFAAPGHYFWEK